MSKYLVKIIANDQEGLQMISALSKEEADTLIMSARNIVYKD